MLLRQDIPGAANDATTGFFLLIILTERVG